ncbi:MAG: hypothetical protein BWY31_00150 [Lentisphaerae bacterium ADurb.Bin242]|nr:MAG: hypothetical protein BWY31_00150 [Lentisphaerae bacterium ADurb.Bin242]
MNKKNLVFAGIGLASSCISVNALGPDAKILESTLAGSWYEANPALLRKQIGEWMGKAALPPDGSPFGPIALIQPHAGYMYSGPVAAFGAKAVAGRKYDRVVILGPTHRVYLKNTVCLPQADGMRTPLGTLEIDQAFAGELRKFSFVQSDDRVHQGEHSVQIQLPFLQAALAEGFKIVPIVVGQLDAEYAKKVARALAANLTPSTLVVASSDFTHFGRNFDYVPFQDKIPERLRQLDLGAFELIRNKNCDKFTKYIADTGATICGEAPIRVLLEMLPDNAEVRLLKYATSAEATGDYSHSVSYLSACVDGKWEPAAKLNENDFLSNAEKKTLLAIARESIDYVFQNRKTVPSDHFDARITEHMKKKMGCFVTLKIDDELRGCIGEIQPFRELYRAVMARAVDSAFRDIRFRPLTPEELRSVEVEISALTPAKPVNSYKDIVIGKHGMTLTKDGRSAVFLPQVAPEQGWNLEETLTHLARKAGLSPDAWKSPDASFTVFEAIVFKESDFSSAR